ncbi:hypothetical protein MKX01_013413 [Papaver californicum]|nr:hypothetical protein MKX01_013413 [Papaver californicum]
MLSCYGEVNNMLNLINKDKKERSISYPEDTNWDGLAVLLTYVSHLGREFTQIRVKPGNGPSTGAHKFVLATRSEILKNMLESDLCKAAPDESISLPEFNHEELDTFLDSSKALQVLEISDVVSNEKIKLAALELIVLQYKEIILVPSFDEFAKQNPHLVVQITRAAFTSK